MTNYRPTIQNFITKYIFIIVLVSICKYGYSQDLPISYCLSNCKSCTPQSPFQCISTQQNGQTDCIPLFVGSRCTESAGYKNILTENGGINNPFLNWSQLITQNCSVVFGNNKNVLLNQPRQSSLGPFNSTGSPLVKIINLPNRTINQIVIKVALALKGDNLVDTSVVSQTNTNENGSTVITTTTTQQVINGIPINNYPFLTIDIVNTRNQQNVHSAVMTYAQVSPVETTCGYIYQYQIIFNVSENLTAVRSTITYIGPQASTWNLLDFRVDFGCGGFIVENGCSNCLNGFYPVRQPFRNLILECGPCPPNCKTCSSNTSCLVCQPLAKLNQTTNLCQNQNPTSKSKDKDVFVGRVQQIQSEISGNQAIISSNGTITFQTNFGQNQPVLVKFLLLFSKQYLNNNPSLVINYSDPTSTIANQYRIDIQSIQKYGGVYIPELSNTSKLYFRTIILNENFTGFRGKALKINIQSNYKSNNANQSLASKEFFLVKYQAIQFQCSSRCAQCTIAPVSVCLRCEGFFDRTSSCQNCANGFYLQRAQNTLSNGYLVPNDICIKCHSTCKQCLSQARDDCTQCFEGFQLDNLKYNYQCISCVYQQYNNPNNFSTKCTQKCINNFSIFSIRSNINCSRCLQQTTFNNFQQNIACRNCWIRTKLAGSRCQPNPAIGYSLYGTDAQGGIVDLQSWSAGLTTYNCSSIYSNLYGVAPSNSTSVIQRIQRSLPPHKGLIIIFNIFKVGNWNSDNLSINVSISQTGGSLRTKTVNFNNSAGTDLCAGLGNEMIFTYYEYLPNHNNVGAFTVRVTGPKGGLFVRQVVIYLGNCNECTTNNLNFGIQYIPKYFLNSQSQSGLDVWLKFNSPVTLLDNKDNEIQKSFNFSINKLGLENLLAYTDFKNNLDQRQQLYYFLPLNRTFLNGTLFANTTQGDRIIKRQSTISNRLLIIDRLEMTQSSTNIQRYDNLDDDYLFSFNQICDFLQGITWFALFTMIVCAFFGIGIIFEEFSILLQLLFLHVYISSAILAASFKIPVSCMEKIQNLNFFAYPHAKGIEDGWIGDNKINSPHVFQQYNVDIFFLRTFYPIIIINLIYLAWFILLFILQYIWEHFQVQNKFLRILRNIPKRPVNYADQIWRYQFITTIWAASIYFHDFSNDTDFKRVNIALTIFAFVISLIWPIFVMVYTFRRSKRINIKHFQYSYQDIFYRKAPTNPELKYFIYIAVRFARYFIFAIFIAQFIKFQFVAPTVLLIATVIELVYILYLHIYQNKFYLALKIIESLLFIVVEILIMIMEQFSDTMTTDAYFSIGYALTTIYIIMIVNGLIRVIFLAYKKGKDFWNNRYSYGDQGKVANYDGVKVVEAIRQEQVQE